MARRALSLGLPVAVVFAAAVALRFIHLNESYDVFLDETIYTRIADGAALHGRLYFGAYPFLLHGPLYFYLQGGLIDLLRIHGTTIQVVHALRHINIIIAGLVAALLFSLVETATSRRWAFLAAGLFALDPFIIRFDSRVFLETFATMWTLVGYRVLATQAVGGDRADQGSPVRSMKHAVGAGVAFGLALLVKETSAGLYLIPLLWCIVRDRVISRRSAVQALLAAAAVYAPYPLIVAATGDWHQFVTQKFNGVLRLIGAAQVTGFNSKNAPSFASRLTADLSTFAMTYVLIGLGALSVVWLYRNGSRVQRIIALWAAGAFVTLAFQIAQGTLEEQMFYYLVVPSIAVVTITAARVFGAARTRWVVKALGVAAVLAAAIFDATVWGIIHTHNDTAIVRTVSWVEGHVPAQARVAPLVDGTQFLLPRYVLTFDPEGRKATRRALRLTGTQFVLTSSLQIVQGYGGASPQLLGWLRGHATVRFRASGPSNGEVVVWQIRSVAARGRPPGPEPLRPQTPMSVGGPG